MPKFGGAGTRRQPCMSRRCTGLAPRADGDGGMEEMEEEEVVSTWLQCDRCSKWRIVLDMPGVVPESDEAQWFCEMNLDRAHNECSAGPHAVCTTPDRAPCTRCTAESMHRVWHRYR